MATVVVKIGTSSITGASGEIDVDAVGKFCAEVAAAREAGHRVVVVTSGAIAAGLPALGRASSWAGAAAASAEAAGGGAGDGAGSVFRTGDDVIHAAFGDGVITATEPGGIVVVRFAQDGSERKLMADYAPIRRR